MDTTADVPIPVRISEFAQEMLERESAKDISNKFSTTVPNPDKGADLNRLAVSNPNKTDNGANCPINNVCLDVLQKIFGLCTTNPTDEEVRSITNFRRSPLLLTHVCRHWRDLAISTPELWELIRLSNFNPAHSKEIHEALRQWFERSNPLPVYVFVLMRNETLYQRSDYIPIADALAKYSKHLRLIWLVMSTAAIERLLASTSSFPVLESMNVDFGDNARFYKGRPFPIMLKNFPSIRHVTHSYGIEIIPAPRVYRYHIRDLRVNGISVPDIFALVMKMPLLELLSVVFDTNDYYGPLPAITLPRLKKMVLDVAPQRGGSVQVNPFLGTLTLPSLKCISLVDFGTGQWDILGDVITRSTPPLKWISYQGALKGDYLRVLHLVPGLEQLAIGTYNRASYIDLTTRLTWSGGGNDLLPNLQSYTWFIGATTPRLVLNNGHSVATALASMIKSRFDPEEGKKLFRRISVSTALVADVRDSLIKNDTIQTLVRSGFELELHEGSFGGVWQPGFDDKQWAT